MRIILDAHISGVRVGTALEGMGDNVRAVDQEQDLERLPDEILFGLAVAEGRVLVTHNVKDFSRLLKERPPERSHPGLILIPRSVKLNDFGTMISGIQRMLSDLSQEDWIDRVEWIKRGG